MGTRKGFGGTTELMGTIFGTPVFDTLHLIPDVGQSLIPLQPGNFPKVLGFHQVKWASTGHPVVGMGQHYAWQLPSDHELPGYFKMAPPMRSQWHGH